MKICVIGQGYIGLPTAALFASNDCEVIGVDIDENVVNKLNTGTPHIEEPGIKKILEEAISEKKYKASTSPETANVFIITVPTPTKKDNFTCDLTFVESACKSILPYLEKGNIVIIESTIAPTSTDDFIKPIFENEGFEIGENLYLAHCPERVLPGKIMEELINNDRIVGGITPECTDKAIDVYETFVKGNILKTEAKTAELSKCMENTFRDVNIALANELTKISSEIGVNALDVIELANKHPRVNIHSPGPGVGGHCLAIDPYFIYSQAPNQAKMIKLARDINNSMPEFVVEKTEEILNDIKNSNEMENSKGMENSENIGNPKDIENPKIAILGISYKGNTGDIRESPAIEVINLLKMKNYDIRIFDPHVEIKHENDGFKDDFDIFKNLLDDLEKTIENTDICLILTDHDEFKDLNYESMIKLMKNPVIFDTKNIVKRDNSSKIKIINYGNL